MGCGVGFDERGGVSDSGKLFSPKISPPKYLRWQFQDDGLEILTQKQKKNWIDLRRVFANLVSRPSIILNGGSEKTQNYATFK